MARFLYFTRKKFHPQNSDHVTKRSGILVLTLSCTATGTSDIIGMSFLASLEVGLLAEVRLQEGEPLENALRRFKRKVQQEDIIKEVKRHSYYLKPGEKRRVKAALARKRNRKKARKEQD
jgi:small subunit ribosomal protein S21